MRHLLNEDLGFSEIAEQLTITRQAVYDATQQGRGSLEKYEQHLGLLEKQASENKDDSNETVRAVEADGGPDLAEARKVFSSLEAMAGEDILYDTRRLRLRLKELKGKLWPR